MPEENAAPGDSGQSGQYIALGTAIGAGLGLTIGALMGGWGIPIGLALGAGAGIAVGAALGTRRGREAH